MAKKNSIKKDRHHIIYIIAGFAIGAILTGGTFGGYWLKIKSDAKNSNSGGIIAPYYNQSAFHLPKELENKKISSDSSVLSTYQVKLPIIMYHYIEYVKDAGDLIRKKLDITPANFENQLKSLKEAGFTTYFVRDIPGLFHTKSRLSSKDVILTFDDGYEDFYTDAFPILKKYQMKATLYVVNNFIGLKGYLNEGEVREIIDSGLVEIGAHTLDHVYLKRAPLSYARKQIFESKKLLEDKFGIKVDTFAYPYGAFSKEVADLVKEASYTAAVSVIPGAYQSEENLFYLSRIRPGIFMGRDTGKILENWKQ
ncbi:polysaccharide deacetylase family protein [Candidatus Gottesmanbacteria bacterium]|nr:polysaccharide deacetylase family protein [Candidatus Gottesmanbacteria bacterium]